MRHDHGAMDIRGVVLVLACVVPAGVLVGSGGDGAHASLQERCERIAEGSELRRDRVVGSGARVAVIGDSYSQGLGLDDPAASWPSRLEGRVVVDGFSGSGFSPAASRCRDVAYAERVDRALATDPDLVVLQGGLNDFDVEPLDVLAGARAALGRVAAHAVVVVGPPSAPRRADAVETVDALLSSAAAEAGVPYVRAADWELEYLPDRLHLTAAGHRAFGDRVAAALDRLG
jgi:acyl-CoA thioesterase-1